MDAPINVWNEVRVTAGGISITLLSESAEGGAVVEDETWFTFAELQEQSPSAPISLNLSDETQSAFEEQLRLANIGLIYEGQESDNSQELPEVGDIMSDQGAPSWSVDDTVEVVEVLPDTRCDEYVIGERLFGEDETVAVANPSYDEGEPVVIGKYDGSGDEYAFPVSRLEQLPEA